MSRNIYNSNGDGCMVDNNASFQTTGGSVESSKSCDSVAVSKEDDAIIIKQKQPISSNKGDNSTVQVETNDCPVLNTQDSGKGASEGDGSVAGDDVMKRDGQIESVNGVMKCDDEVEGDAQTQGIELTELDEEGAEDSVDCPYLMNESTAILQKYFPILLTYFSQDLFQVAIHLHSKGLLERRTRNAVCELNGIDSEIKAHMILQQLELRFSRRPATLVECVYVLRDCLPSITDVTQDMLDEYNTAQIKSTTKLNECESLTTPPPTFDTASASDRKENQDFHDSSAPGNDVRSLQQMFSLEEDDLYMLTQRLTKVLRTVSLAQETKVRDTNRKLLLTQEEVLELQQQVRETEREKRLLQDEVKQLKWLVEDTRRKNQLLNEDVVRYHLELEKCKKACEQKQVSTTGPTHCEQANCEFYDKYIKLEKECVKHKAEIENLNERVAICVRLNSNDSN